MAIHWAAYHLNKMLQDALRNRAMMGQLFSAPEPIFDEYGLSEKEKLVFRNPDRSALQSLGVHPVLAMVYMIPRDKKAAAQLTIDPVLLNRLMESR